MTECPAVAEVLRLVLRQGGAYAGDDPAFHRVRLAWQLAALPWAGVRTDGALVLGPPWPGRGVELAPLAAWVSWMDVADVRAWRTWSLDGMVADGRPLPFATGPDLYLFDVAVADAGSSSAVRRLWRALRARRPHARAVGWHRERADGRRRFTRLRLNWG